MMNLSATLVDHEESLAADLGITDTARPRHYALRPIAALRAVLDAHKPVAIEGTKYCGACRNPTYPCATVRAITSALDYSAEPEAPPRDDAPPRPGEHRNGCRGCEHEEGVIPGCWSEEDTAAWYAALKPPRTAP